MMLTPEQVQAAAKANLETLLGLTSKAVESMEKLVQLNVAAVKAAVTEASDNSRALAGAKDIQEILNLQASHIQPLAEKTATYSRHLYDIFAAAGAHLGKVVEVQAAEGQKKFQDMLNAAAKNAPAGSESAVAVIQSAVAAANNAVESVQKAVRQATEVVESNFKTITENTSQAIASATEQATQKSTRV